MSEAKKEQQVVIGQHLPKQDQYIMELMLRLDNAIKQNQQLIAILQERDKTIAALTKKQEDAKDPS